MNMEERVGVVVEGGQMALNSSHGSVTGARKFLQQQQQQGGHSSKQGLNPQIGTIQQLLAGAFSKTCTAPLARLTILFQIQGMYSDASALSKATIWCAASRIINEEGFKAFWKGNLVTIFHRLPYTAVNFYAYERYKILAIYSLTGKSKGKFLC